MGEAKMRIPKWESQNWGGWGSIFGERPQNSKKPQKTTPSPPKKKKPKPAEIQENPPEMISQQWNWRWGGSPKNGAAPPEIWASEPPRIWGRSPEKGGINLGGGVSSFCFLVFFKLFPLPTAPGLLLHPQDPPNLGSPQNWDLGTPQNLRGGGVLDRCPPPKEKKIPPPPPRNCCWIFGGGSRGTPIVGGGDGEGDFGVPPVFLGGSPPSPQI